MVMLVLSSSGGERVKQGRDVRRVGESSAGGKEETYARGPGTDSAAQRTELECFSGLALSTQSSWGLRQKGCGRISPLQYRRTIDRQSSPQSSRDHRGLAILDVLEAQDF